MNSFKLNPDTQEYTLPEVYTMTKSGKQQCWNIYVKDNYHYSVSYLMPNGKRKISLKTVCTPKNIGKSNETTAEQQAMNEAYALWKKKSEQQYICMLAQNYVERGEKYLTEPFAVSPKLDGIRALARFENGQVELYSRNNKKFIHLHHIKEQLLPILKDTNMILDGELYSHEISFNELSGMIRKHTSSDNIYKIQYWIFDTISNEPYYKRIEYITKLIQSQPYLRVLEYDVCTHDDIQRYHGMYIHQGYEGLIARELSQPYEKGVRSNYLLKYKEFKDEEFEITGFKSGVDGGIIFECITEGNTFHVKPRGELNYRKQLLHDGEKYIGKQLTVRYQEKMIVPRFPVGIAIRNYE
jgi:DNA ligase-1